jgi:hypothetical protein
MIDMYSPSASPINSMLSANRALFVAPSAMNLRHVRGAICPGKKQGALGLVGLEFAQPEFATYPQQVFTAVNFVVLPFWGMMIAAPKVGANAMRCHKPLHATETVTYPVSLYAWYSRSEINTPGKYDISLEYCSIIR